MYRNKKYMMIISIAELKEKKIVDPNLDEFSCRSFAARLVAVSASAGVEAARTAAPSAEVAPGPRSCSF
jgi:hypothetical protein